jgi:rubrerythrin
LAEKAKDEEAKTLFSFMAGEEKEHYQFFEKLCSKFEGYEVPESYDDEYEEYMQQLVDSSVFTKDINVDEVLEKAGNVLGAIDLALGAEKDSIILYLQLKKIMPAEEQSTVDEIIEEENRHIGKLLLLKKNITQSGEDFYASQKTWDSERQ